MTSCVAVPTNEKVYLPSEFEGVFGVYNNTFGAFTD